jgi:hypothetical protein
MPRAYFRWFWCSIDPAHFRAMIGGDPDGPHRLSFSWPLVKDRGSDNFRFAPDPYLFYQSSQSP